MDEYFVGGGDTMHNNTLLFNLIRIGLGTAKVDRELPVDFSAFKKHISDEWRKIYDLGVKQGVAAQLFDGLQNQICGGKIATNDLPPHKDLTRWLAHSLQVEKVHRKHEKVIAKLAGFYASYGIRMMVIKGYGLSFLYPLPNHRPCGDIDIWLYGEQERADRLLHKEYGVNIEKSDEHHSVFHIDGVMVENHRNFLDVHSHLSNKEVEYELREQLKTDCNAIDVDGTTVYLPPANFNALFLLRHAAGHFAAAEIALRHVTDWAMFVKRYHEAIDWDWLCEFASKQNMLRFMQCLNGICVDYIGLSENFFPKWERDKALEERIMSDILYPVYEDKSALYQNFLKDYFYRFRRWWGQRWKHKLVYKESLLISFLVLLRSHFVKPKVNKTT